MSQPTRNITPSGVTAHHWMRRVRDDRTLSPTTKTVAIMIALRCNRYSESWPSYSSLADDTGLHRRTIIRAVDELRRLGLVLVISRINGHGNQSNLYRLNYPQDTVDNGDLVTQNHHLVTQEHSLGSDTAPPRRTKRIHEVRQDDCTPVDNPALRAYIADIGKRHTI